MTDVRFRPEQQDIIFGYQGGRMGIAAVPGSGKTFTLSHLAARLVEDLIAQGVAQGINRQEVLIVTFTNTAVNSFRSRIAQILGRERGLLPYIGYRVRTLHGLAHDIVRERPALVGLPEDFQIVDEILAEKIIREVAQTALKRYGGALLNEFINRPAMTSENTLSRVERSDFPDVAVQLALRFIKHAKNLRYDPRSLREKLGASGQVLPLVTFGLAVYEDYQRSLSYRGAVDFDDLIRLALSALQEDMTYCRRLQERWPYVLEDEAQDSSKIQEEMLSLLSGGGDNWIRVGDPNQAINTTFTTADPRFLRDFLTRPGVKAMPLHTSGRSARPIWDLANRLVSWTVREHPVLSLRDSAFLEQEIRPTSGDDPQSNPVVAGPSVHIAVTSGENITPEHELEMVAESVIRFLRKEPQSTIAVLAPENSHISSFVEALHRRGVTCDEQLVRTTSSTREAARKIQSALHYLSNPLDTRLLAHLYQSVWSFSDHSLLSDDPDAQEIGLRALHGCRQVEDFLWPSAGADWLRQADAVREMPGLADDLNAFRQYVRVWLQALTLPIDQLVLTIVGDLCTEPAEIALGHKIAAVLRGAALSNPGWRLPEFVAELRLISENERKFLGFDDVDRGYEPQPGLVTVATMHAAKGLEWDRVYLLAVSNYGFPSAQAYDNYFAEKWFVRDRLNLEAEILAQLQALDTGVEYVEGDATRQARLDYAAERLRLLYVGITRARRHLIISWNMGRFWKKGDSFINRPALPLVALWQHWQAGQASGSQ